MCKNTCFGRNNQKNITTEICYILIFKINWEKTNKLMLPLGYVLSFLYYFSVKFGCFK